MRQRYCVTVIISLVLALPSVIYAQANLDEIRFNVDQFEIVGDNPVGESAYAVLEPYIGEQFGLEGLSAATDALEQAIIKQGYSFHRVSLPPQQLFSGTVKLKVSRFSIGRIAVEGNQFFDEENILNSIPELSPGKTPNTNELSRSVKLANTHASKNVVLRFKEGGEADTIDASLTVKDRNPQLFFVTLDNTGTSQTEEYRTTLGYQHGNLFNRDHAMTATLTTAPEDPDSTTQLGLNYHIPLYGQGASLDILFSDSEVNSGLVGSSIEVSGKGSVLGFIYNRPFLTSSNFNHAWSVGIQNKLFENAISNSGAALSNSDVLSLPVELGYSFNRQGRGNSLSGGIRLATNLSSGSKGNDVAYNNARPGAKKSWSAIRYNLAYDRLVADDWLLHVDLSAQESSDLLISGEQFGVGGASSLRGFEERSVTGDKGYEIGLEVWMPAVTSYQLRFLVFYDIATLEFHDDPATAATDEATSTDLSSAGFGMRWSWRQNLNLSLDYGQIIKGGGLDPTINQDGDDKLHFNLVYRF